MDLALDTGIFLGFAHEPEYESHHASCARVFRSAAYRRFVSDSVERELANRVRQRRKLYQAMTSHVGAGRKLEEFDFSPWNDSDASHGRRVLRQVGRTKPTNLVTFLRQERTRFEMAIEEAANSLQAERIPRSSNTVLEAALNTVLSREDARNVNEYLCWASSRAQSCFVAIDRGVTDNRGPILRLGADSLTLTSPQWDITHVSAIV